MFRKGQYFRVTALDDNGNIMPPSQFKKVFQDIVDTVGGVYIIITIESCLELGDKGPPHL